MTLSIQQRLPTELISHILAFTGEPETTSTVNKTWRFLWDSNIILRIIFDNLENTKLHDLPRILTEKLEQNPSDPTALKIFSIMQNHRRFLNASVQHCHHPKTLSRIVSFNGLALEKIDFNNPQLCQYRYDITLKAVQKNWRALRFADVAIVDEAIVSAAVTQDPKATKLAPGGVLFAMEG